MGKTRNPLGWGYIEDRLDGKRRQTLIQAMQAFLGGVGEERPPPAVADVTLTPARVSPPDSLADCVTTDHETRLLHAVGRSFRDLAGLRTGGTLPAPDAVAAPHDRDQLAAVMAWASDAGYGVIPFGGGSSVVGGVNPEDTGDLPAVISLDLQGLNRVHEIDETDRVVHADAGILGPDLDAALKPHGLAVRHYPQSYFHSTLGGWVATRGAGHFSTLRAKIEDRVQALTVLLPDGREAATWPLPASSVGIDPNRLWAGSEGALGVITDVRLRVVPDPAHRENQSVGFADFETALAAARALLQADVWPAQMRVLDPYEHFVSGAMAGNPGQGALMILGFEGERADLVAAHAAAADEIVRAHGGKPQPKGDRGGKGARSGGESNWRDTFFAQPYLRDALLDYAVLADTFETAVPWSRATDFYHAVRGATQDVVNRVGGQGGVTCRVTHAYPDGVALYFSFYAPGRHDALVEQWREIKAAASDAVSAGGGTISHHHAMGRDHKPWAANELPAPFRAAIRGAKRELDPRGLMNPGLWFED